MICSVFGTAWWKNMRKEKGEKFVLAALKADTTKHLSNLLIHSSFFINRCGRSNIPFSQEEKGFKGWQCKAQRWFMDMKNPQTSPGKCTGASQVLWDPWGFPDVPKHWAGRVGKYLELLQGALFHF